jgi:hypothetical protein
MKCEYGLCLVCEKKITDDCMVCASKKPNSDYTEVHLKLNNGSLMPVAVCTDCKDKVFYKDRKAVMEAVRQGWRDVAKKQKWNPEHRIKHEAHFKDLEIVD